MKEHPILFSGEMVKAILEGRKTQTRRIIKPQPDENGVIYMENPPVLDWEQIYNEEWKPYQYDTLEGESRAVYCPYGNVGDQLWVRETFSFRNECFRGICYRADSLDVPVETKAKWKPSIFMPRKASRIQLEIVNIRVERLNNISGVDCIAEGIDKELCKDYNHDNIFLDEEAAKEYYQELWEKINGKESWEKNSWTWVIEFKRIN